MAQISHIKSNGLLKNMQRGSGHYGTIRYWRRLFRQENCLRSSFSEAELFNEVEKRCIHGKKESPLWNVEIFARTRSFMDTRDIFGNMFPGRSVPSK